VIPDGSDIVNFMTHLRPADRRLIAEISLIPRIEDSNGPAGRKILGVSLISGLRFRIFSE